MVLVCIRDQPKPRACDFQGDRALHNHIFNDSSVRESRQRARGFGSHNEPCYPESLNRRDVCGWAVVVHLARRFDTMIKVECVSCKAPYELDPRRIPDKGMKMRCPKCGTSFMVSKQGLASAIGAGDAAAPALRNRSHRRSRHHLRSVRLQRARRSLRRSRRRSLRRSRQAPRRCRRTPCSVIARWMQQRGADDDAEAEDRGRRCAARGCAGSATRGCAGAAGGRGGCGRRAKQAIAPAFAPAPPLRARAIAAPPPRARSVRR